MRFSRGRSTPTSRAMGGRAPSMPRGGLLAPAPGCPAGAPASDRGYAARRRSGRLASELLALPLLVAEVLADHHDATVPADHLALVADLLDAGLDLHRALTCTGRRCGHGTGRTGSARRRPGPPAGCGCSAGASCR